MKTPTLACTPVLLAAIACAATGPTPQLVDARRAYEDASHSQAATYSPDKLLSAKQALERAEAAHDDDPGSLREESLAYVAERKAEYAATYGQYEKDRKDQTSAEQAYRARQDTLRRRAEQRAQQAQNSLAATWDNLSEARQQIQQQKAELQKSQAQLDEEKKAREAAEKKADAAVASLSKVAQVKEEQRGVVITLSGAVLFITGKAELLPIAEHKLDAVAKVLKDLDDNQLASVEGYTDSRGAEQMNLKLSQERANAVKDYLVSKGVPAGKLRAVGHGEADPVASNATPEGRADNRRVEIVIQNTTQAADSLKQQ